MKRKPSKTGFTKLLAGDTTLLSPDPLIGPLELETDSGPVVLLGRAAP
ncbi:hypothetical protein NKH36_32265 [Mesorhizobium sp. M1312]